MKQLFDIPEMHCASCVMLIEELEDEVEAVKSVKVDLGSKTAEIEFNEKEIATKEVANEIKNLSGYEAHIHV